MICWSLAGTVASQAPATCSSAMPAVQPSAAKSPRRITLVRAAVVADRRRAGRHDGAGRAIRSGVGAGVAAGRRLRRVLRRRAAGESEQRGGDERDACGERASTLMPVRLSSVSELAPIGALRSATRCSDLPHDRRCCNDIDHDPRGGSFRARRVVFLAGVGYAGHSRGAGRRRSRVQAKTTGREERNAITRRRCARRARPQASPASQGRSTAGSRCCLPQRRTRQQPRARSRRTHVAAAGTDRARLRALMRVPRDRPRALRHPRVGAARRRRFGRWVRVCGRFSGRAGSAAAASREPRAAAGRRPRRRPPAPSRRRSRPRRRPPAPADAEPKVAARRRRRPRHRLPLRLLRSRARRYRPARRQAREDRDRRARAAHRRAELPRARLLLRLRDQARRHAAPGRSRSRSTARCSTRPASSTRTRRSATCSSRRRCRRAGRAWVGSRMYRGDDIYLFDYWPLDDLNTVGGGVLYHRDLGLGNTVEFAAHGGENRLDHPFQFQETEVAESGAGRDHRRPAQPPAPDRQRERCVHHARVVLDRHQGEGSRRDPRAAVRHAQARRRHVRAAARRQRRPRRRRARRVRISTTPSTATARTSTCSRATRRAWPRSTSSPRRRASAPTSRRTARAS